MRLALQPIRRKPVMAYYYVTYKCTARCVFCNIPDGPMDSLPASKYSSTAQAVEHLDILEALGVAVLDLSGGEPLLREDLPVLLREARKRGFLTQLTTNCTLYPRRADELRGLVDNLCFSLCSPGPEPHNSIRRDRSYEAVLESMSIARRLGEPHQIIFVLTRQNAHLLEGMITFCSERQVVLQVQPEWKYFGNAGVDPDQLEALRGVSHRRNVHVNWGGLRVAAKGGNDVAAPACHAAKAVIAISPDGYLLYPCFHRASERIRFDWQILDFFETNRWREMREAAGRLEACSGCTNFCYILPSLYYSFGTNSVLGIASDLRYLRERWRAQRERAKAREREVAAG